MNSIANYKASLSRIANEVFDAADDLDIPHSRKDDSPASARRISHRSSRLSSPKANGIDAGSGSNDNNEISKYKADIQRLQSSEAELKAFSLSYAAMLKEKEEQLSKLREENGSLRRSMDAKESAGHAYGDENFKASADRSPSRSQRNSRSGNHLVKNSITKQDGFSNGSIQAVPFDATQPKIANSPVNEGHKQLLEEIKSLNTLQASYESEIKQLKAQLDSERESASTIKLKLKEECQLKESSLRELQETKIEKEKTFSEMKELQKELGEKIVELKQLQVELSSRGREEWNETLENLKNEISVLKNENAQLKTEKNELATDLELHMKSASESRRADAQNLLVENTSKLNEKAIEEMELSVRKMEKSLEDTCKERDRALQELNRLKQHLLEKELEDSDKMDEDSKAIEELRATTEHQRVQILYLENALKKEVAKQEEIKKFQSHELQKSNETIIELKQKLAISANIVDSKNIELQNLQSALGQYYAESEAKERLGRDLAAAREESTKLFNSLKGANQELEVCKREKEDMIVKLSHAERMLADCKRSIQKLDEDNSKLRRALEQNMTRLNRMSLDSDNYVDRRIVIKLLVTYFQRNHSKEVLDLMVRMLGFSEEDKQRIGAAQSAAGKGVVRGVLGLPGRLVGGILGGGSPETSSSLSHSADNQSFADLWVDFLLKETEERERRETEEAARMSSSTQERSMGPSKPPKAFNYPTLQYPSNGPPTALPPRPYQHFEHSDSEFATVPLTPSVSSSGRNVPSRIPPK